MNNEPHPGKNNFLRKLRLFEKLASTSGTLHTHTHSNRWLQDNWNSETIRESFLAGREDTQVFAEKYTLRRSLDRIDEETIIQTERNDSIIEGIQYLFNSELDIVLEKIIQSTNKNCPQNDPSVENSAISNKEDVSKCKNVAAENISYDENPEPERANETTPMENILPEKNRIKLSKVVEELIETEKRYVEMLNKGIKLYVNEGVTLVESGERNEFIRTFLSIIKINDFHSHKLLPKLIDNQTDVKNIGNVFHQYVINDDFYPYILYQIDNLKIETLCERYNDIFEKLQKKDPLGIRSFLVEPIQRLPRYKLLFDQILNALHVNNETAKQILAACSIAHNQVCQMNRLVDQATILKDISISTEFDWKTQGNFKQMSTFVVVDGCNTIIQSNGSYVMFYFEKSILLMEKKENAFIYHRHILLDDILYIESTHPMKIVLHLLPFNISFSGTFKEIRIWKNLLKQSIKDAVIDSETWSKSKCIRILKRFQPKYMDALKAINQILSSDAVKFEKFLKVKNQLQEILREMSLMLNGEEIDIAEIFETFKEKNFNLYIRYAGLLPEVLKTFHTHEIQLKAPLHFTRSLSMLIDKIAISSGKYCKDSETNECITELQKKVNYFNDIVWKQYDVQNLVLNKVLKNYGTVEYFDTLKQFEGNQECQLYKMKKRVIIMKGNVPLWNSSLRVKCIEDQEQPDVIWIHSKKKDKTGKISFDGAIRKRLFLQEL